MLTVAREIAVVQAEMAVDEGDNVEVTSSRIDRGHGSPPTENSSNAPSANPGPTKSAPSIASTRLMCLLLSKTRSGSRLEVNQPRVTAQVAEGKTRRDGKGEGNAV